MNPIAAWDRVFHRVMGLPVVLATVSESARAILDSNFGRGKALIVPNGVDARRVYHPPLQGDGDDRVTRSMLGPSRRILQGDEADGESWTAAGLPPPTLVLGRTSLPVQVNTMSMPHIPQALKAISGPMKSYFPLSRVFYSCSLVWIVKLMVYEAQTPRVPLIDD